MTLVPSSDFGIRGHEGKPYDVNPMCAAPECMSRSVHAHHMWSRSHLRGQPYEFVELPDGTVIGNRIGLCLLHHTNVTGGIGGYIARVAFKDGVFWWENRRGEHEWERIGPLDPQPPGAHAQSAMKVIRSEEVCPTCGHHKRPSPPPGEKRNTKTWACVIPDDAEIGSVILDEWVVHFAELLGFADESSRLRRYHALAIVLAWAHQSSDVFVADLQEAMSA